MSNALKISGLSFRYRRDTEPALKDINIFQDTGEAMAVTGRSGAGKSSLIRCLNRIIPHFFPGDFSGNISLFGESINGLRPFELADRVGVVFQDFESQLFCTQAELDVAFGPENLGIDREEIKRRVKESLELVGMQDYMLRDPSTLSGGQKQRLAIATVLALSPKMLAMDEVTTDLDPQGREEVVGIVRDFASRDIPLILVEHEPEILRVAESIVLLDKGGVECRGSVEDILGDVEKLESAGVRPPVAAKLFFEMGFPERPIHVSQAVELLKEKGVGFSDAAIENLKTHKGGRASRNDVILTVEKVSHSYRGGIEALKDVSLEVHEGEFIALVGKNGSGKTTLVKHLNGLLKPTSGKVFYKGRPVGESSVSELGRHIGFVFQNPDHQIFSASVYEEIAFGPRNHGLSPKEVDERVQSALDLVGLSGCETRDPFIMTKGERQRIAVASILAMNPRVTILDEPTTGLDYAEQIAVMDMLAALNRKGHTIIIITHTLWLVARYADRVVLMAEGDIIEDGLTREVLSMKDSLVRASLRVPEIVELGSAFGFPVLTVEEFMGLAKA